MVPCEFAFSIKDIIRTLPEGQNVDTSYLQMLLPALSMSGKVQQCILQAVWPIIKLRDFEEAEPNEGTFSWHVTH